MYKTLTLLHWTERLLGGWRIWDAVNSLRACTSGASSGVEAEHDIKPLLQNWFVTYSVIFIYKKHVGF